MRHHTPLVELITVGFAYSTAPVLRNVSFTVGAGELIVLTGANGAGKSTLLQLLFGLLEPTAGRVVIIGGATPVTPESLAAWGAAYVPQGHRVFRELTVRAHLELVRDTSGVPLPTLRAATEALFPELLPKEGTLAGLLSGGERQMLLLAMALSRRPRLLLLDEPSAGLAKPLRQRVAAAIVASCNDGAGVVIAEHDTSILNLPNVRELHLANGIAIEHPQEARRDYQYDFG